MKKITLLNIHEYQEPLPDNFWDGLAQSGAKHIGLDETQAEEFLQAVKEPATKLYRMMEYRRAMLSENHAGGLMSVKIFASRRYEGLDNFLQTKIDDASREINEAVAKHFPEEPHGKKLDVLAWEMVCEEFEARNFMTDPVDRFAPSVRINSAEELSRVVGADKVQIKV